jgi:hypothetical protein
MFSDSLRPLKARAARAGSDQTTPARVHRIAQQPGRHSDPVPASVDKTLYSSGRSLDPALRKDMERRFGYNFSQVQVHFGGAAEQSVRDVRAHAYTVGHDIVFGAGQWAPHTQEGRLLLAHELAHTVQQSRGETRPLRLVEDAEQEREAHGAAAAAVSWKPVAVISAFRPRSLSRQKDDIDERRVREQTENLHTLHALEASAEPELDYWERTARQVFGAASYDAYCGALKATTFFGFPIRSVHDDLIAKLQAAENDLRASQGPSYKPPRPDSALRKKRGMHGWGMAVDFDVLKNPYVLNESGEKELDKELLKAYNRIADFMLGKSASDLGKLKGGRAAFGGSIASVYDALREESDAMKRYFAMLDNEEAISSFVAGEWQLKHPGVPPPSSSTIKADIRNDYEVLGGVTVAGGKRPTGGKGDRPFAPTSSNFQGDPATGFLNLDKDFVEALTGAGLAWGAIDIAGEPGDIQHFDLRLSGTGKRVYELMLK